MPRMIGHIHWDAPTSSQNNNAWPTVGMVIGLRPMVRFKKKLQQRLENNKPWVGGNKQFEMFASIFSSAKASLIMRVVLLTISVMTEQQLPTGTRATTSLEASFDFVLLLLS